MKVLGKPRSQGFLFSSRLARFGTLPPASPLDGIPSLFSSSCLSVLRFSFVSSSLLPPLFEKRAIYTHASHDPYELTPSTRISSRASPHNNSCPSKLFDQNRHLLSTSNRPMCVQPPTEKGEGKRKGKKRHETKRDRSSCIMNDEIVSRIDSPWFLSLSLNGCLGRKKKNHKLETSCGYRRRLVRHSRCGISRCQWFPLYRRVQ